MNDNYFNGLSEVYKVLLPDGIIKEYNSSTFDTNKVFNELISSYNTSDVYSTLRAMSLCLENSLMDVWRSDIKPIFSEGGIECSLGEIEGNKYYAILRNSDTTNVLYIVDEGPSKNLYYIDNIGYTREELIDYVLKWTLSVLD